MFSDLELKISYIPTRKASSCSEPLTVQIKGFVSTMQLTRNFSSDI